MTEGFTDITPPISSILTYTPAMKIGSSIIVGGIGGNFIPGGGGGSSSSMNFYKCASVGSGTWTGYLASVDPITGIWSFAETATGPLSFDRLTPVVGNVYDEGCTFQIIGYKKPAVFQGYSRLPLTSSLAVDEGDELDYEAGSGYSFTTKADVECMLCDGLAATFQLPSQYTSHDATFSFWAYADNNVTGNNQSAFALENCYYPQIWCDGSSTTRWKYNTGRSGSNNGWSSWHDNVAPNQQWNLFVLVYQGNYAHLMINGSYANYGASFSDNVQLNRFSLGAYFADGYSYKNYIADVRMWTRRLSDNEVTVLYNNGPHTAF